MRRVLSYTYQQQYIVRLESKLCLLLVLFYFFIFFTFNRMASWVRVCVYELFSVKCEYIHTILYIYAFRLSVSFSSFFFCCYFFICGGGGLAYVIFVMPLSHLFLASYVSFLKQPSGMRCLRQRIMMARL